MAGDDVVLPFQGEAIRDEVLPLQHIRLQHKRHALFSINIIITFLNIHGHKVELRLSYLHPPLPEPFILVHDVVVVEHGEAVLVHEHFRLQILQHHVYCVQFLVRGHRPMTVGNLPVEGHDWPECLTLRNESQLAGCKVIGLALPVHLFLFHGLERLFEQVFNRHSHYHAPDGLPVVKDARIVFLFLSGVEVAAKQTDYQFLEYPLQNAPQNPVVLVPEVIDMLCIALVAEPAHFVGVEAVKQLNSGEGFKAIEADKSKQLLIEDLFVLAFHEALRKDLLDVFGEKVSYLSIAGVPIEKFFEDFAPLYRSLRGPRL